MVVERSVTVPEPLEGRLGLTDALTPARGLGTRRLEPTCHRPWLRQCPLLVQYVHLHPIYVPNQLQTLKEELRSGK